MARSRRTTLAQAAALAFGALVPWAIPSALANSGPENSLVIIDPGSEDALQVGHRFVAARGIPAANVLYMRPDAASFAELVAFQGRVVTGTLEARGIQGQIDQIILAPTRQFFVPAGGLVAVPEGGCPVPVNRFAMSMAYSLLPLAPAILDGAFLDLDPQGALEGSHSSNPYFGGRFRDRGSAAAFRAQAAWLDGRPSEDERALPLLLGSLLGWTGERGNTVAELEAMIDRGVRADGTAPAGTFYFMETPDGTRTRGRLDNDWARTIRSLAAMGGQGEVIQGILPIGRHDALGVLTGIAGMDAVGADFTLRPGAFADHLTSFAATFDEGGQSKMSQWITKGASGTIGTVEEPCTGGKFPVPDLHAHYVAGLSLGEAVYRSLPWLAFESLLVGDALAAPFAAPPELVVDGLPQLPVGGRVALKATARAGKTAAAVSRFRLLADGLLLATVPAAAAGAEGPYTADLTLDTTRLADGWHAITVLAIDGQAAEGKGRVTAAVRVRNRGRGVGIRVQPSQGEPNTVFSVTASLGGSAATEVRLLQNGRLLQAIRGPQGQVEFQVLGQNLGPGPSALSLEADYPDLGQARSEPVTVQVDRAESMVVTLAGFSQAFEHTLTLAPGTSALVDLPAYYPDRLRAPIEVVQAPAQSKVVVRDGAVRLDSDYFASGLDSLTYQPVERDGNPSGPVTVHIRYCLPGGDPREEGIRHCPGGWKVWLPRLGD